MSNNLLGTALFFSLVSMLGCAVHSGNSASVVNQPTTLAQPTRESLEIRLNDLVDTVHRRDLKKIPSFVLGGKGAKYSWNRQRIWELGNWKPEMTRCKHPIIYIWGYCAYTRCVTDKYISPNVSCPDREGAPNYWLFRGGQWYLAEPPYRNSDPELSRKWILFIENHKNKPCDSRDNEIVIHKTKQFMDLMMEGKIEEAAKMYSLWSSYKVCDTSFNLEDGRIDQACLFYDYDLNSFYKTVNYEILEPVEHQEGTFAIDFKERTCFYKVKIKITKQNDETMTISILWFKEDGDLKVW